MAFGMAGDADARDAMSLQQSAGADVPTRLERTSCARDIARDQEDAPGIGLTAQTRKKVVKRFA
jgi:hypothetical protein